MLRAVIGYLVAGGKAIKRLSDEELERFDRWFTGYKEDIERELGRKLTRKEEERLYKLLLGIMVKEGEYDERYHKWLLGHVIGSAERMAEKRLGEVIAR